MINITKYYSTIKIKPVDVKSNTYIDSSNETNNKDSKFKIGDIVWISNYKNIFTNVCTPNWSEEVFVVKKIKNTVPWTCIVNGVNGEKIVETFYENKLEKTKQKEFRIEKVIKRKGDKLQVKCKGYNSSFNSWINKKDIV